MDAAPFGLKRPGDGQGGKPMKKRVSLVAAPLATPFFLKRRARHLRGS